MTGLLYEERGSETALGTNIVLEEQEAVMWLRCIA